MEEQGNVTDQLGKLADLRQRGALSDREFETQKRQLLDASRRRSVRSKGILAAVVVGATALILMSIGTLTGSPANTAQTSSDKVQFSSVSLTQSQVQTAINYAMGQVGHSTYNLRCLQLVSDAYAQAGISIGSSSDPVTYWASNPKGYTEHSAPYGPYASPPAGAILFWGQTQWSSDGHAAISLGNGSVVSSAAYPYADGPTNGQVFKLSSRSPSTYHYLGYLLPGSLTAPSPPPPAVAAPPVPTDPEPAAATPPSSSASSQAVGTAALQPAAGTSALQGSGSGTTPGESSSGQPSTPPSTAQPATTPGPVVATTTTTSAPSQAPAPQPAPQPLATYSETVGGVSHTWTDYGNAGGSEGPSIPSNQTVQIACKVTGFKVADGNTWWYRIASSPWDDGYYVSADAFYNDGATSGSLIGTPFVDPSVPSC